MEMIDPIIPEPPEGPATADFKITAPARLWKGFFGAAAMTTDYIWDLLKSGKSSPEKLFAGKAPLTHGQSMLSPGTGPRQVSTTVQFLLQR